MKIKIQKLHENAVTPTYAHEGDACFDLTAVSVENTSHALDISEGRPLVCGTGLAFQIPEGHAMLIFSRSGHGFKHDIRLANCVGIIDHGFSGEVMVKLACDAPDNEYWPHQKIKPGDRIAQAMIIPVEPAVFEIVEQLALSERGTGGFGSSGV